MNQSEIVDWRVSLLYAEDNNQEQTGFCVELRRAEVVSAAERAFLSHQSAHAHTHTHTHTMANTTTAITDLELAHVPSDPGSGLGTTTTTTTTITTAAVNGGDNNGGARPHMGDSAGLEPLLMAGAEDAPPGVAKSGGGSTIEEVKTVVVAMAAAAEVPSKLGCTSASLTKSRKYVSRFYFAQFYVFSW